MSDRLNQELLSAYLDNEVTEEERALVEQALANSPETRRSLDELKQVQARLQSLPRFSLPDDFHARVMREAERRAAAQTVSARSAGSKWVRFTAIASTVAAVLVIALLVAIRPPETEIVENSDPNGNGEVRQLPDDGTVAVVVRRPKPEMILVLDLAITDAGQRGDVFGNALNQSGGLLSIRAEEGVSLNGRLRNSLLSSRLAADLDQPAADKANDEFDVIDMVYVQGTGVQIDEIHRSMSQSREVRAVLDVAMRPETNRVLNSIGERSWSLAKANSPKAPRSYAYRLNVGIALHSNRTGFLAKFPTPGLDVRVIENDDKRGSMSGFNVPIPFGFGGNQPKPQLPGDVNAIPGSVAHVPIYEILVIRRNLKAGFPNDAQQLDPK